MLRAAVISVLTIPAGLAAFLIGWLGWDLHTGIIAGIIVFGLVFIAGITTLFFVKTYDYLDAFLPVAFAIIWSLILLPFTAGLGIFSAFSFIGSAILLGACMIMGKKRGMGKAFLLLPAIVFLYEMLPVNIPGPFDDLFALGGSVSSTLFMFLKFNIRR